MKKTANNFILYIYLFIIIISVLSHIVREEKKMRGKNTHEM